MGKLDQRSRVLGFLMLFNFLKVRFFSLTFLNHYTKPLNLAIVAVFPGIKDGEIKLLD